MEFFYSVVRFFTAGGVFMLPILAVGAVGAAIAVERYITITRMRVKNRALWAQIEPAIMAGEFDKAREITGKSETALSRLLGTGLEMQGAVRRRDDVKEAMQESMMEILPQLEKHVIPDAAHSPQFENPQPWWEAISAFLAADQLVE